MQWRELEHSYIILAWVFDFHSIKHGRLGRDNILVLLVTFLVLFLFSVQPSCTFIGHNPFKLFFQLRLIRWKFSYCFLKWGEDAVLVRKDILRVPLRFSKVNHSSKR